MAKYLARSCPRCSGYLGIVMRRPTRNISPQAINGRCLQCGYRLVWTSCEAEGRRWGSALLVVHHTKTRCVAAWREKGGSQCSQTLFFSSLPRWPLRSCGGAADSRYVGGVDHV